MKINKGDKVKILETDEEALVVEKYHWGLIGVLIFIGFVVFCYFFLMLNLKFY